MGAPLSVRNQTNPRRDDYRSYYTDETRQIVANVYRRDIEVLGYDFDNSSLRKRISDRGRAA